MGAIATTVPKRSIWNALLELHTEVEHDSVGSLWRQDVVYVAGVLMVLRRSAKCKQAS